MQTITTIGLDIAKSVFQVHGIDVAGQVVIRRQLKRRLVLSVLRSCRHAWLGLRLARHPIIGPASCRRWGIRCG
jgi:transposase